MGGVRTVKCDGRKETKTKRDEMLNPINNMNYTECILNTTLTRKTDIQNDKVENTPNLEPSRCRVIDNLYIACIYIYMHGILIYVTNVFGCFIICSSR